MFDPLYIACLIEDEFKDKDSANFFFSCKKKLEGSVQPKLLNFLF